MDTGTGEMVMFARGILRVRQIARVRHYQCTLQNCRVHTSTLIVGRVDCIDARTIFYHIDCFQGCETVFLPHGVIVVSPSVSLRPLQALLAAEFARDP